MTNAEQKYTHDDFLTLRDLITEAPDVDLKTIDEWFGLGNEQGVDAATLLDQLDRWQQQKDRTPAVRGKIYDLLLLIDPKRKFAQQTVDLQNHLDKDRATKEELSAWLKTGMDIGKSADDLAGDLSEWLTIPELSGVSVRLLQEFLSELNEHLASPVRSRITKVGEVHKLRGIDRTAFKVVGGGPEVQEQRRARRSA